MGFVVKITSFLYRYLNGRDEKISSKNRVPGGEIVLEGGVLGGGDYCSDGNPSLTARLAVLTSV